MIERNDKFYSEVAHSYYVEQAKELIQQVGTYITLYKVDIHSTEIDDIYGETHRSKVIFNPPLDIPCTIKLSEPIADTYNDKNSTLRDIEYQNIKVSMLVNELESRNINISYGDIFIYKINNDISLIFEVSDEAAKYFENDKMFFGYKPTWKSIYGVPSSYDISHFENI